LREERQRLDYRKSLRKSGDVRRIVLVSLKVKGWQALAFAASLERLQARLPALPAKPVYLK
jgi:hypothetical protein